MFQLDDNFLEEVGLGSLPDDQKKALLQHVYDELELRVGTKLSEGLSETQMQQFEAFVDRNEDKVRAWFTEYLPDFDAQPDYQQIRTAAPADATEISLMSEYGSLKWLELNRPDYRQIVAEELDALRQEMVKNRDTLLGQSAV